MDIRKIKNKAQKGDTRAQTALGVIYYFRKNYKEAANWFRLSTSLGGKGAPLDSLINSDLLGYPTLVDEAISKRYKSRAENDDAVAQYFLGRYYETFNESDNNIKESIKWYLLAADQGLNEAKCKLAHFYYHGVGVSRNLSEAILWWYKAAVQGHGESRYHLGKSYHYGIGLEQSYIEAIKWWNLAASDNHIESQYSLGLCYEKGTGVIKDEDMSLDWYIKASNRGHNLSYRKIVEYGTSGNFRAKEYISYIELWGSSELGEDPT